MEWSETSYPALRLSSVFAEKRYRNILRVLLQEFNTWWWIDQSAFAQVSWNISQEVMDEENEQERERERKREVKDVKSHVSYYIGIIISSFFWNTIDLMDGFVGLSGFTICHDFMRKSRKIVFFFYFLQGCPLV